MYNVGLLRNVSMHIQRLLQRVPTVVFAALFVGLFAAHTYRTFSRVNAPGITDFENRGYVDFHNAIYFPGKYFLSGGNPYSPAYTAQHPDGRSYPLFPTHSLLLHLPFSFSSLEAGRALYLATQVVMLIVFLGWIARDCGYKPTIRTTTILGSLLMLTVPFYQNFYLGQLTLQVAFGTALALRYAKEKPWIAAVGLAISAMKPQVGVIVAVLMLFRRDFKAVFGGASIAAAISLIGLTFIFLNVGITAFWNDLLAKYFSLDTHPEVGSAFENYRRIDLYPVFERFLSRDLDSTIKLLTTAGIVMAGGIAVARTSTSDSSEARWLSSLLITLTTLLAVYHSNYDAMLLFWPIAWLLGNNLPANERIQRIDSPKVESAGAESAAMAPAAFAGESRVALMAWLIILSMLNVFTLSRFLDPLGTEYGVAWRVAASSTAITLFAIWCVALSVSMTLPRVKSRKIDAIN